MSETEFHVVKKPAHELRHFTDEDWETFSGAECLPSGNAPMIGEIQIGDELGTLVVCGATDSATDAFIGVNIDDDFFGMELRASEAITLALALPLRISRETLSALGFESV